MIRRPFAKIGALIAALGGLVQREIRRDPAHFPIATSPIERRTRSRFQKHRKKLRKSLARQMSTRARRKNRAHRRGFTLSGLHPAQLRLRHAKAGAL